MLMPQPSDVTGPFSFLISPSPASDASLRVAGSVSVSLAQFDVGCVVPFLRVSPFFFFFSFRSEKQSATRATSAQQGLSRRRTRLLLRRRETQVVEKTGGCALALLDVHDWFTGWRLAVVLIRLEKLHPECERAV